MIRFMITPVRTAPVCCPCCARMIHQAERTWYITPYPVNLQSETIGGSWYCARAPEVGPATMPRRPKRVCRWFNSINMRDYPGERRNLYADNPDKVKELLTLLKRQVVDGRSNPVCHRKTMCQWTYGSLTPCPVLPPASWTTIRLLIVQSKRSRTPNHLFYVASSKIWGRSNAR